VVKLCAQKGKGGISEKLRLEKGGQIELSHKRRAMAESVDYFFSGREKEKVRG